MDTVTDNTAAEWAKILDESEAEIDAGLFVPAEEAHRMLQESIAKREATAVERHAGKPASPRL
jgi:predicted transcriptional regulator